MTKQYRTREGEATSVDTKTQLTTVGSESAPGPLLVPAKATRLLGMIVAIAGDYAAVGSASCFVRLEGAGLPKGPEVFAVGALGGNSTTGIQGGMSAEYIPIDVEVTPGNEILIFGEMAGADIGSVAFVVTLVFKIG